MVGDAARRRQLVCRIGRRQGLLQQVPQCAVALGNEPEVLDGRGGPESPELVEGADALVQEDGEQVPGNGRLGLPVFRFAQPVKDFRAKPDFLMDCQRRRALPKPGVGLVQELGPPPLQARTGPVPCEE